jgi:hypothetical protein
MLETQHAGNIRSVSCAHVVKPHQPLAITFENSGTVEVSSLRRLSVDHLSITGPVEYVAFLCDAARMAVLGYQQHIEQLRRPDGRVLDTFLAPV